MPLQDLTSYGGWQYDGQPNLQTAGSPTNRFRMIWSYSSRSYGAIELSLNAHTNVFKIVKYLQTGKIPKSKWLYHLNIWESVGVTNIVVIPSSGWGQNKILSEQLEDLQSFAEEAGIKELSL